MKGDLRPEWGTGDWCICELDPGHGPTPHRCRCGNSWGIGMASPECRLSGRTSVNSSKGDAS